MANKNPWLSRSKAAAFYIGCPAVIAALILALWLNYGERHVNEFPKVEDGTFTAAAEYGDSFGYVNALFSGFAFGGIIFAIVLQTKELSLQRQELADTRKQVKRSADSQQETERVIALTAYLNTLNALREGYAGDEENDALEFSSTVHAELIAELNELVTRQRSRIHSLFDVRNKVTRIAHDTSAVASIALRRWQSFRDGFSSSGNDGTYVRRALKLLHAFSGKLTVLLRTLDSTDTEEFTLHSEIEGVIKECRQLKELTNNQENLKKFWNLGHSCIALLTQPDE